MTRVLQKTKFSEKRKCALKDGFASEENCPWENWALAKGHLTLQWSNREHWVSIESPHTHLEFLVPSLNQRRGTGYLDWACVCTCVSGVCLWESTDPGPRGGSLRGVGIRDKKKGCSCPFESNASEENCVQRSVCSLHLE